MFLCIFYRGEYMSNKAVVGRIKGRGRACIFVHEKDMTGLVYFPNLGRQNRSPTGKGPNATKRAPESASESALLYAPTDNPGLEVIHSSASLSSAALQSPKFLSLALSPGGRPLPPAPAPTRSKPFPAGSTAPGWRGRSLTSFPAMEGGGNGSDNDDGRRTFDLFSMAPPPSGSGGNHPNAGSPAFRSGGRRDSEPVRTHRTPPPRGPPHPVATTGTPTAREGPDPVSSTRSGTRQGRPDLVATSPAPFRLRTLRRPQAT